MRVCFVCGEFPPMEGGLGDYTWHLSQALERLGIEAFVVTSQQARTSQEHVYPVVERWNWTGWLRIAEVLREVQPTIVHIQYQAACYGLSPFIGGLPLAVKGTLAGARVVTTFHDLLPVYLFPKAGPLRHLPASALALASDRVVLTAPDGLWEPPLAQLLETYPALGQRIAIIPIGSNIPVVRLTKKERERLRTLWSVGEGEIVLCHFGFLHPNKGLDVLLEALARLAGSGLAWKLVMIGGAVGASDPTQLDEQRRVRSRIEELRLGEHMIWTGFLRPDEISTSLQSADIAVLPFRGGASLRHGTLMAVMAHGLPTITTAPKRPEAGLHHGENAWLIQPNSSLELAQAIGQLAADAALRERLSVAARGWADSFRWERVAAETQQLYSNLAGNRP